MTNPYNFNQQSTKQFIAKTFYGLEEILATELKDLGAEDIQILRRAVSFYGDLSLLYRANLHLRTALRILMPFYQFTANNEEQLYKEFMKFDWSSVMQIDQSFAIDQAVFSKHFRHSKYVALKAKDAIVDQFRKKYHKRPSVNTEEPDILLNLHVKENEFSISLDSSGDSLHKRGYRPKNAKAPLNEVLSAGMILITGWDKQTPLIDPMCGSGTNLMEAALIAQKIPPALFRKRFGFMNWGNFDQKLWEKIYSQAKNQIEENKAILIGGDINAGALRTAKESARNFSLEQSIKFIKTPFEEYIPSYTHGLLVINPPYGERMKETDINRLYKSIGDHLKKNFPGFEAWILSPNKEALKNIGLKPAKKMTLYNGSLECKYQKFELYQGSRKKSKSQ